MVVRQPRYSKEEFAQRGDALYEAQIRSQVEEGNHGKIVRSRVRQTAKPNCFAYTNSDAPYTSCKK